MEKILPEGEDTKIPMDQYYGEEYDQYAEGTLQQICVCLLCSTLSKPKMSTFFPLTPLKAAGQNYGDDGYPVPSEDEYYQQEPERTQSPSIADSTTKGKPMPTESSFFIFSSKNRYLFRSLFLFY